MSDTPAKVKKEHVQLEISNGRHTLFLAKQLTRFIKEKKLCTVIQGKEFVGVDGWQFAGSQLGIVAIVESIENLSKAEETKYQAKVRLHNIRTDMTMGYGFAICSNKEDNKKRWAEYAIASMAQTRAIGKAYRNLLSWIIKAAGFEPTPAEEMDYQAVEVVEENTQPVKQQEHDPQYMELITLRSELLRLSQDAWITREEREYAEDVAYKLTDEGLKKLILKYNNLILKRAKEAEAV